MSAFSYHDHPVRIILFSWCFILPRSQTSPQGTFHQGALSFPFRFPLFFPVSKVNESSVYFAVTPCYALVSGRRPFYGCKSIWTVFGRNTRRSRGLTQSALAEQLHVTDKAVSRWERGLGFPDINTLEPLAEALGLTLTQTDACRQGRRHPFQSEPGRIFYNALPHSHRLALCQNCPVLVLHRAGDMGAIHAPLLGERSLANPKRRCAGSQWSLALLPCVPAMHWPQRFGNANLEKCWPQQYVPRCFALVAYFPSQVGSMGGARLPASLCLAGLLSAIYRSNDTYVQRITQQRQESPAAVVLYVA